MATDLEFKLCSKCKQLKSFSEYNKCSRMKLGLQSQCRLCQKLEALTIKSRQTKKIYTIKNRTKISQYSNQYYHANKERISKTVVRYRARNIEKLRLYRKHYRKKRLAIDIHYKLQYVLRNRLKGALKGNYKSGSAIRDLGCSIPKLKQWLESQFQPGMTWENHCFDGWHIDHIRPLSSFDLTNREEFLKACHYTNLQPLWAKDNYKKGGKLNYGH